MRAVVYQGNQQFAIRDLGDPAAHGQVVVDVEFCAICGTDVHAVICTTLPALALSWPHSMPPPQVRIPTTGSASLACHTPKPCVQSPYHRQSHS